MFTNLIFCKMTNLLFHGKHYFSHVKNVKVVIATRYVGILCRRKYICQFASAKKTTIVFRMFKTITKNCLLFKIKTNKSQS